MSRKYNCAHPDRSKSNYPNRPGLFGPHSRLEPIEGRAGLRARQERRLAQTGVPWPTAAAERSQDSVAA